MPRNAHARFLDSLNRKDREQLYRCRWSEPDAERVVPKLIDVLACDDHLLVDEAMRALFLIGTPVAAAATHVIRHQKSEHVITRRLVIQALGNIAYHQPEVVLAPIIEALEDDNCREDAIRVLACMKRDARKAVPALADHIDDPQAQTRKAIVNAVASIDGRSRRAKNLFRKAASDRSQTVRRAAESALKAVQ